MWYVRLSRGALLHVKQHTIKLILTGRRILTAPSRYASDTPMVLFEAVDSCIYPGVLQNGIMNYEYITIVFNGIIQTLYSCIL